MFLEEFGGCNDFSGQPSTNYQADRRRGIPDHQHRIRMLRAHAEAFEDDDEEQGFTGNLTDTQPLTNVQRKFILLLEGLRETRNNVRVGAASLSNLKPERLTGLLNNLLEIGVDLNKEQLIQIRGLIETIFTTTDKRRLVKDNN